ncbi:hypothetical protein [Aquihabitans sp. McL0605]|uniref:hypothetical protein n=1 Tax=Aquihabitans sp. McL0605 TaxID=3415671 RepID=UPI003CF7BC42
MVHPGPLRRSPAGPLHDQRWDRIIIAIAAAVPLLIGVLAASSGWRATGDNALIGVRVSDLLHGHLLTSGLPTTGENFGSGILSNHPGPLPFYVLAPFQWLYGIDAGLALGAAAINGAAWAIAVWVMVRRHGLIAGVLTLGVYGALAFGLGAHVLYDPVSSNIAAFASLTLVLVAAEVIAGDWKLLPVFVIVGSFVIQAHLTYVALGIPLVAVVAGALVVALVRRDEVPARSLIASAVIGVVVWAPVMWDQFFGTGNISSIVRTFSDGNAAGKGVGFAASRVMHALAPVPMFARPSGKLGNLSFLDAPGGVRTALGVAVLVAFGAAIAHLYRTRSAYLTLAGIAVLVLLASVYSASKLPPPSTVKAANLRWMWTGGALIWLVLLLTVAELATRRWRAPDILVVVSVIAALGVLAGVSSYWTVDIRDQPVFATVDTIRSKVADATEPGTFIVKYQGEDALLAVGPPIVADLIDRGYDIRTSLGPFDRAYGDHVVSGRLPAKTPALIIATAPDGSPELAQLEADRAHDQLIASASYDPKTGGPRVAVRVYVAGVQASCDTLVRLGKEIVDPNGTRPKADVLDELSTFASSHVSSVAPLLSRSQLATLKTAIDRIDEVKQQATENPDLDLLKTDPETLKEINAGIAVILDLCM